MGTFDTVRQNTKPKSILTGKVGLIWTNILIKYNYETGEAEVLRAFSKPAKDSTIKSMFKPQKKDTLPKVEIKESQETQELF